MEQERGERQESKMGPEIVPAERSRALEGETGRENVPKDINCKGFQRGRYETRILTSPAVRLLTNREMTERKQTIGLV
jgi:hypothetical protein